MNSECVDLIYLDPPFNSNRTYEAPIGSQAAGATFKDAWTLDDVDMHEHGELADRNPAAYAVIEAAWQAHGKGMQAYLIFMAVRLIEMHRVLKPTGSIYLHCDPTASHYLKMLMDSLFGRSTFKNEIAWCYRKWSVMAGQFVRNHDVVLFYAGEDHTFNPQFVDPSPGTMKRWKGRRQQAVFVDGIRQATSSRDKAQSPCPDWWEISVLNANAKERTGYPTQKPLALLDRILKASSDPGDMVLDPFCGCATALVVADRLSRQWAGIDLSPLAVKLVDDRIAGNCHGAARPSLMVRQCERTSASCRTIGRTGIGSMVSKRASASVAKRISRSASWTLTIFCPACAAEPTTKTTFNCFAPAAIGARATRRWPSGGHRSTETGDAKMPIERKEVRVKPNRYQPTRAEVEEVFETPRKADGSAYTVNEAVRTLMQPVKIVEDPEV